MPYAIIALMVVLSAYFSASEISFNASNKMRLKKAAESGNKTASLAHVTLLLDGQTVSGVSDGDGPIDASFRAIEQAVGCHYELDDFQIQAVTEGKEALGAALVKLRSNGKLYSGNGISTDIVGASIRAYLNALNKIVFEENG